MPGDLGAYRADVVTLVDTEMGLHEINDREIAGGPAIGDSAGLEGPAPGDAVGVGQLVEEAGLAPARFAPHGHGPALTGPRPLQPRPEPVPSRIAAHRAG